MELNGLEIKLYSIEEIDAILFADEDYVRHYIEGLDLALAKLGVCNLPLSEGLSLGELRWIVNKSYSLLGKAILLAVLRNKSEEIEKVA